MVDDLSPLSKSATPKPWTEVISHCFEFSTQIWIRKKETGILTRIHLYAVQKIPGELRLLVSLKLFYEVCYFHISLIAYLKFIMVLFQWIPVLLQFCYLQCKTCTAKNIVLCCCNVYEVISLIFGHWFLKNKVTFYHHLTWANINKLGTFHPQKLTNYPTTKKFNGSQWKQCIYYFCLFLKHLLQKAWPP